MVGWSTNLGCGNSGCGVDVHSARLPDAARSRSTSTTARTTATSSSGRSTRRSGAGLPVESHVRVAEPGGRATVLAAGRPGRGSGRRRRLALRGEGEELIVDDHCQVVGRGRSTPSGCRPCCSTARGWSRPGGTRSRSTTRTAAASSSSARSARNGPRRRGGRRRRAPTRRGRDRPAARRGRASRSPCRGAGRGARWHRPRLLVPHVRARGASRSCRAGARAAARERDVVSAALPSLRADIQDRTRAGRRGRGRPRRGRSARLGHRERGRTFDLRAEGPGLRSPARYPSARTRPRWALRPRPRRRLDHGHAGAWTRSRARKPRPGAPPPRAIAPVGRRAPWPWQTSTETAHPTSSRRTRWTTPSRSS